MDLWPQCWFLPQLILYQLTLYLVTCLMWPYLHVPLEGHIRQIWLYCVYIYSIPKYVLFEPPLPPPPPNKINVCTDFTKFKSSINKTLSYAYYMCIVTFCVGQNHWSEVRYISFKQPFTLNIIYMLRASL